MIRLFVRHAVADFATWKQAYDSFDNERQGLGVAGHAVYQSTDNANEVTVWHDFDSLESARAFVESERLREVMATAGVVGEPQMWFATPA
jgi:hypothetical protein